MSRSVRVLHVITKLELGGAQINTLYTAAHLDRERFDVMLASGPGGLLEPDESFRERWRVLPSLARPIHPGADLHAYRELRALLREFQPNIVHTHSSKAGIIGRLAAWRARVPVTIHSVHGFSFSPLQPPWQRTIYRLAERLMARSTTHFIFVSQDDFATARRLGLVRENGSLIRSGFPLTPFLQPPLNREQLRRRFGIPEGTVVVGVIAPFKTQKGLFHLLHIARRVLDRHPETRFLIAGDGALRPSLEAAIAAAGMEGRILLPGFVRDIEAAIACFDIGVSTALWEGLPQSLVQMRLMKVPLVVSDIPGNREVVIAEKNGLLAAFQDYAGFSAQISRLIEDKDLRATLGSHTAEDFSEWDADVMVRRQEELYLTLLDR